MARPTDYNEEVASQICALIAEGNSLRKICLEESGMPDAATVYRWLAKHDEFRDNYAKAQTDRASFFAEEIVEISDDASGDFIELGEGRIAPNSTAVARDKLKVDTRKWLMARMDPKRYGDKVTNEVTGPNGGPVQVTRIELVAPDDNR